MRGKRAKKLRQIAEAVCKLKDIKLGDGYGQYNQAMNRLDWEQMVDPDGYPAFDGEGIPLLKPVKVPGTITCAWKFRVMYQGIKRKWYDRRRNG